MMAWETDSRLVECAEALRRIHKLCEDWQKCTRHKDVVLINTSTIMKIVVEMDVRLTNEKTVRK